MSLISIPRLLAADCERAQRLIRDLYCDKRSRLERTSSREFLFSIDDDLASGLLRDPVASVAFTHWFGGSPAQWCVDGVTGDGVPVVLCAQHDRVLPALANQCAHLGWTRLAMLHVDAHADLQSPTATAIGRFRWCAPVGDAVMDLDKQAGISGFVDAGYIGIGGFLLPILAAHERATFVHLAPGTTTGRTWRASVQALSFARCIGPQERSYMVERPDGPILHVETGTVSTALLALPTDVPLLLDIDFDAWCNVYDDTSAGWPGKFESREVLARIEADMRTLQSALATRSVALISCALSPQFFPVSLWPQSIDVLTACWRIDWSSILPWKGANGALFG